MQDKRNKKERTGINGREEDGRNKRKMLLLLQRYSIVCEKINESISSLSFEGNTTVRRKKEEVSSRKIEEVVGYVSCQFPFLVIN